MSVSEKHEVGRCWEGGRLKREKNGLLVLRVEIIVPPHDLCELNG